MCVYEKSKTGKIVMFLYDMFVLPILYLFEIFYAIFLFFFKPNYKHLYRQTLCWLFCSFLDNF